MASPDTLATMREQLAAAQAEARVLREALDYLLREWLAWQPGLTGMARTRAERALSRAPGSDDALREMLAWAVSEGARAGEEGARTGRSETNESIVSRILGPEGGKA